MIYRITHAGNILRNKSDSRLPDAAVLVAQYAKHLYRDRFALRIEQCDLADLGSTNGMSTSVSSVRGQLSVLNTVIGLPPGCIHSSLNRA